MDSLQTQDVKVNSPSPTSQHNQNVNVLVYPEPLKNPYNTMVDTDKLAHYPRTDESNGGNEQTKTDEEKPAEIVTRSVETASSTLESLKALNDDKDQIINALNQLLDIYENNPLVVNKYVIADDMVLSNLIQALTGADEVCIYKDDYEPKCFEKKISFSVVQKIIVRIGDEVYNLKYNYANVVEFLDKHHISIKFVY